MKRRRAASAFPLWRWRLRHPSEALRAAAPRYLPLAVRLALLQLTRPFRSRPVAVDRAVMVGKFQEELALLPMTFTPNERPAASVLIVTYNNLRLSRLCIESVMTLTEGVGYEIVVVDNGSTDGTAQWLEEERSIRLIRNQANRGFPAAANQAAAAARGEVLCFLNNDTVVSPQWLATLTRHAADEAVGVVGASTNAIANEARVALHYDSLRGMIAEAEALAQREREVLLPLPTVAFFCVALRRSVWERVGPLDERFGIGMFEDDDYCRRVRMLGLDTVCARDVFIHHWQMASFKLLDDQEYLRIYRENEKKYRAKWGRGGAES